MLSFQMDISDDGRLVAFFTRSPNMADPAGPTPAVYLRDLVTGETINVTAPLGAAPQFFGPGISLSGDGTRLAISWRNTLPDGPDPSGQVQIWVFDIIRGVDPQPPVPVPGPGVLWMALLGLLVALGGVRGLRSRFRRHWPVA